jgi:hypothetical protein
MLLNHLVIRKGELHAFNRIAFSFSLVCLSLSVAVSNQVLAQGTSSTADRTVVPSLGNPVSSDYVHTYPESIDFSKKPADRADAVHGHMIDDQNQKIEDRQGQGAMLRQQQYYSRSHSSGYGSPPLSQVAK